MLSCGNNLGEVPCRRTRRIEYGVQLARGLAAAHRKGITHRDLKPDNIFITREARAKILDFGLAKLAPRGKAAAGGVTLTSSPTEAGMVMGTAGCMAPEQVRGSAVDSRTDIFAFGAVLEMPTGQRAFNKPTAADTMSAILNEDPPDISQLLPTTAPAVQRTVRRCLGKGGSNDFSQHRIWPLPSKRYQKLRGEWRSLLRCRMAVEMFSGLARLARQRRMFWRTLKARRIPSGP